MEYVGVVDLVERWIYQKQSVHRLVKRAGFPKPVIIVNRGRNPVWELPAIEQYEAAHPELTNEAAKFRKRNGYYAAVLNGERRPAPAGLSDS